MTAGTLRVFSFVCVRVCVCVNRFSSLAVDSDMTQPPSDERPASEYLRADDVGEIPSHPHNTPAPPPSRCFLYTQASFL